MVENLNLTLLKTLTTLNQQQIYNVVLKFLKSKGYTNIKKDEHYILAEGELPVCLVAHIDTVFKRPQIKDNFIYDDKKNILWGIGGSGFDDRAGIYAIIELVQRGCRPHILFTDLEESGGIGAQELITKYPTFPFDSPCNALIELDRANEKDAVYYSCNNEDFEDYIESFGFVYDIGTFSDISIICPVWNIAGVNLSVGYNLEHSESEYIRTDWLHATIDKVELLLSSCKTMKFYEYVPIKMPTYYYHNPKISYNTCLICGSPLDKNNRVDVYDIDFPYAVCKTCYSSYYAGEENPF